MRTFAIWTLSCASVLGADTGIHVATTSTTNTATPSIIHRKDVFTRDGQTNLLRITDSKAGVVQIQIHHFYRDGQSIGYFVSTRDSSGFFTKSGSQYSVSFEFGPTKDVKSAVIGVKDSTVVDAFTCTNGIFVPVESSLIKTYSVGTPNETPTLRQWSEQWNEQRKVK